MNVLLQAIDDKYGKLLRNDFQELSFSQTTPYLEIGFAKYFLHQQNVVVSVYPTLYAAMHAYEFITTDETVVFFGADEFISAQLLSASPELLLQRIETLHKIVNEDQGKKIWVITHIAAITRPIVPAPVFAEFSQKLVLGMTLERAPFLQYLTTIGYERVPVVSKPGEVAVRGEIIDVYSPNYEAPLRLSFFDTELEYIFQFDIQNQLTQDKQAEATIIPLQDQFGEQRTSILTYFADYKLLFHQMERIQATYEHMCQDALQFTEKEQATTEKLFIAFEDLQISNIPQIKFSALNGDYFAHGVNLITEKKNQPAVLREELIEYLKQGYQGICLIGNVTVDEASQNLQEYIADVSQLTFVQDINFDELIHDIKIFVFDYAHLLGLKDTTKNNEVFGNLSLENKINQVDEIQQGDYIVHIKHGVGRYDGLQTITAQGVERDYLVLSYQDDEKVYLPTEKIDTLYKYVGSKDGYIPKLSKIGDRSWKRKTQKVQEHIDAFAQNLFQLYLERERIPGYAFSADSARQTEFESQFPYQETPDQLSAIQEIKRDMEQPFVMERILCGDVGFGKTEVAFRAAFKAMEDGKQVVMLAPTTILARQHYENAKARFSGFGYQIKMLSRLVSPKEQKTVLFDTEVGDVQLLIGTHRLLSDDVCYDDLGLVIIDEEHRFGVKAKEKLKQFRKNIDVLLISATPIPRTLQMAVTGIREMSLLQTAPHNRYPVQTYVLEQNDYIVQDAIERELSRQGQTYYLYNKVQTIAQMTTKIQEMFPYATVGFAHGQMPKKQLEDIITKFVDKEIDVLVSTTIIENGMDIPNANTLIVHDADMLGLAQLYQIRGRVGRSKKIAYSYFMYNKGRVLTEEALKRLQTIQSFTEFGSGYQIAMRDLAIRGAGDILGKQQSGFINDVGFDLYVDMLQNAVSQQKTTDNQQLNSLFEETKTNEIDVQLSISAYIPSTYIADESVKIDVYQMLAKINSVTSLEQTHDVLVNRFGVLPIEVECLTYVFLYRNIGKAYGVKNIRQLKNKVVIYYEKHITQTINRVRLFKILHDREIEVKYSLEMLQLSISTLRKEPRAWLMEILDTLKIVAETTLK